MGDAVDQLLLRGDGAVFVAVGGFVGFGCAGASGRTRATCRFGAALRAFRATGPFGWTRGLEVAALDGALQVGLRDGAGLLRVDRVELLGRVLRRYALRFQAADEFVLVDLAVLVGIDVAEDLGRQARRALCRIEGGGLGAAA